MYIFTLIGAEEVVVQLYIFCYSFKVLLIVRYRFLLVVLVNLKVSQIISQYIYPILNCNPVKPLASVCSTSKKAQSSENRVSIVRLIAISFQ